MPKPSLLERPMKNGGVFHQRAEPQERIEDGQTLFRRLGEAINQAATLEELFCRIAEAVRNVFPNHVLSVALRNPGKKFVRTQFLACQGRNFAPMAQMPFRRFCRALKLPEARDYLEHVPAKLWPLLFPKLNTAPATNKPEQAGAQSSPGKSAELRLPAASDGNGAALQRSTGTDHGSIEIMARQNYASALLAPLRDLSASSHNFVSPQFLPSLQNGEKANFLNNSAGAAQRETVLGCVAIVSPQPNAFAPYHGAWLVTLADLLAAGIQKVQLLQERERKIYSIHQLANFSEEMGAVVDLDTALQKIAQAAVCLLPIPAASIAIVELTPVGDFDPSSLSQLDDKGGVAMTKHSASSPAETPERNGPAPVAWPGFPLRATRGIVKRLSRHQSLLVYDIAKSRMFPEAVKTALAQHQIQSYLGMPIFFDPPFGQNTGRYTTPLALLSLYAHAPHELDDIDTATLRVFVANAAQVLAKVRLHHHLNNEKAYFDGLQRGSLEELENFVYVISHNLKTPVVSIQGFANILQEEVGPALEIEHQHFLERIQRNAATMEKMVLDLLEFSRLGRTAIKLEHINVKTLVQSVIDEMCWYGQGCEVEFVFPQQAEPPSLRADSAELKIVFENLISNAVKYRRPEAPLRIEIGWEEQPRFCVFWVRDNGMGMDPVFQGKAFDLFQRGPNVGPIPGTGVGLAIVRRIVANHQGLVRLHSKPGEGTTVYFTLPKIDTPSSKNSGETAPSH